ncbi:hypothetical protein [Piscinibacter terrae]|uniref:Uncharacterized protein n=1 Tax=Piscinibacter terrae TaxID=2496871 RepID=A0A3N7IXI2_9BURK|nr:hypothetical protein [Albitalea terrae]RQP23482.1 hypothetical protein DZC73_15100 [Albitalea terrae]
MRPPVFVPVLVLFAALSQSAPAFAADPAAAPEAASCPEWTLPAMRKLQNKLRVQKVYEGRHEQQCLRFFIEDCNGKVANIAVRERHDETCGGDPATEPVVDRFRLHKKGKRIEWYSVVEGEYLPFDQLKAAGKP